MKMLLNMETILKKRLCAHLEKEVITIRYHFCIYGHIYIIYININTHT